MSHDLIINARQDFEQIASRSKLVTWAEESEFAGQAINRNPKLAECAPQSLREAVTNVAAIGLTLNPALGYAYLVPESVKIGADWIAICQLRVSFKGLMKIAVDSQGISFCRAEIVRKNDAFTYNGPCDKPDHKMDAFGDRGEIVGVYCVVKTPCGDWLTDIMSKADIDKCMAAAKTKNVWQSWYEEMAKKAIIKRASKQWPMGDGGERFNQAVAVVNDAEGSEQIERDITPPKESLTITKPERPEITNEGLGKALTKIMDGELTRERLIKNRALTDEQLQWLDDSLPEDLKQ